MPPPPSSGTASNKRKRSASCTSDDSTPDLSPSIRTERYRINMLQLNGVFIASSLAVSRAPQCVRDTVHKVLGKPRTPLAAKTLETWVQDIVRVEDDGKEAITTALAHILPPAAFDAHLQRKDKQSFTHPKNMLPRVTDIPDPLAANVPRIAGPVPDVAYGLSDAAFEREQRLAMTIPPISDVCEPIAGLFWPFFVVEIKAQAKMGTIYAAINQCAGSGSVCIKAQDVLRGLHDAVDRPSLYFSCALDGRSAELLCHHLSDDRTRYHVAIVGRYLLADASHLERLHCHVHNIVAWGLSSHRDWVHRRLDAQWERAMSRGSAG